MKVVKITGDNITTKPLNQNRMETFIKIIKHTLALPLYPFFAIMWILRQLITGIDFLVQKYINIIKKIIE